MNKQQQQPPIALNSIFIGFHYLWSHIEHTNMHCKLALHTDAIAFFFLLYFTNIEFAVCIVWFASNKTINHDYWTNAE